MSSTLTQLRRSASALLVVVAALLMAAPSFVRAQGNAQSEVGGESRDFRSRTSGRWVDLTTWQVYRSGTWINSDAAIGIPNAATNAFIETNHTIIATRANSTTIQYNGSQAWAFVEVKDLHINTAASVTTTWGSVIGGFARGTANANAVGGFMRDVDKYDGDRFGGRISTALSPGIQVGGMGSTNNLPGNGNLNRIGNQDIYLSRANTIGGASAQDLEPSGGDVPFPRNMELRVYGKLRYYAGSAADRTDRDANIQVTAATIGTGSTIVFRGPTRVITQPQEWSTTLATQTGYFDNTAFIGGATAPNLESAGSVGAVGAVVVGVGGAGPLVPVAFPNGVAAGNYPVRLNNFRGLMGRNSFWTAIFDLGRVVDRNFSTDLFTGPNDDPSTAVGTLQGSFTAGIIQLRRGTVRFEGEALLANEGPATSGSIQIMNNTILQISGAGNIGRTAVAQTQFGDAYGATRGFTTWGAVRNSGATAPVAGEFHFIETPQGPYYVTSRMRYFVVEEGGALDFQGVVGSLSAADVRFNGTVIYSRTGNQNLVENSPYLSYNPNGPAQSNAQVAPAVDGVLGVAPVLQQVNAGENGLFDPFNNNFHANAGNVVAGDPSSRTFLEFGTTPASLGVGTAALWQPSTTAAYSHLVFRGSGTKFMPTTTVTISRALIFQGLARTGVKLMAYPGIPLDIDGAQQVRISQTGDAAGLPTGVLSRPYYMEQPFGGELSNNNPAAVPFATKAGYFPTLAYLRGTGLTGLRQENNIGTTLRGTLTPGTSTEGDSDPSTGAIPQTMWSVYGGNTDPVAFVGFTTASTRPFFTLASNSVAGSGTYSDNDDLYAMYPEAQSYPNGMVLSGSTNREQLDMSQWNKPAVVHGLPAEPSYYPISAPSVDGIGHGRRAIFYGYATQTLDAARFGQVIRQTVDRVNGTGFSSALTAGGINVSTIYLGTPTLIGSNALGTAVNFSNFTPGYPVITNSLYDFNINTTATTTLQYDSEASDIMSQVEFPSGVTGPHNLVMNCASNVTQNLPIRTADYRKFTDVGVTYGVAGAAQAYQNWIGRTGGSTLFGATAGTVVLGPEHTNSTNANLPRNAFDPVTGLYQSSAVYNQNGIGSQITPGVLASAYIDTRPDVANVRNILVGNGNEQYTTGVGLRPSVTLTGTFDGRVRAGFPRVRVVGPTVTGVTSTMNQSGSAAVQAAYIVTAPNDFGRRGDFNNFGSVELRRGNLVIPSRNIDVAPAGNNFATSFNYTFVMSSTAILSLDQANITYGTASGAASSKVGASNALAQVALSEAEGADRYPSFNNWTGWGVRNGSGSVASPAVVRGPAGPANLAGTIVGGSLSNVLFTGGTGGSIGVQGAATDPLAISRAASGNYFGGTSPYPASYGATDNVNTGNTELSTNLGIIGLQAVAPSFTPVYTNAAGVLPLTFTIGAAPTAGSTRRYNAGPEMTSDADNAFVTFAGDGTANYRATTAGTPFSGNNQVFPASTQNASLFSIPGSNSSSYNAGIVRANNAWNIDLPYVRSGLQHMTWLRATTNVLTLVGNAENDQVNGNGLTTFTPEASGLQIYGTIATARGDIDLNGRNIELGGNNSFLVEAFERTFYVGVPSSRANGLPDSTSGVPLWSAIQVSMPRLAVSTVMSTPPYRTGDPVPVYPSRPSSVINNHRSVRAYIGLTSHRNVAAMNEGLGINQVNENVAGLGARIYQTGNPAQFRVRRWQTRGQGLYGALTTRPGVRTADRYWQVETTGTLTTPMGRSEIRLQYIDTDLLNENGTTAGLPPASLNIFRAQGQPFINPNSAFLGPFQALAAQQLVGPDSYNYVKQLTVTGRTQTVNGVEVLNTGNFATGDPGAGIMPDRTNPSTVNAGFQIWAVGIPAPTCLVLRGQRFGGSFGDPIGAAPGMVAMDIPNFPSAFGSSLAAFGAGITAASANNYGPIIGPFKAGVPTVATIVADLLDEFGNVATTNFSTGASLIVGNLNPWNTGTPTMMVNGLGAPNGLYGAVAGNSGLSVNATTGAPVGGRYEWPNVRLDGIASTTVTFTLRNDFVGGPYGTLDNQIVAANGGSYVAPTANAASTITLCAPQNPVQVSLQGGFPFSVTFATQNANSTGAANIYPGASGPFAVPGRVAAQAAGTGQVCSVTGGYDGSAADIIVGQTVSFPYAAPGYGNIAVIVKDRFGNLASFATEATISLAGGNPPVDQLRTPITGNRATSVVGWGLGNLGNEVSGTPAAAAPGIARAVTDLPQASLGTSIPTGLPPFSAGAANSNNAQRVSPAITATGVGYPPVNNPQLNSNVVTFPNFQVWGATSANVTLVVSALNGDPYVGIPVGAASPGNTSSTVCIRPGAAVGIAPVIIPDIYNRNQPDRMPSRMYIGRSNNGDPRTWFFVQAVDEFGNRVDNGPNAYNGGTANITFRAPNLGLPGNAAGNFQFTASNDPYVKANNQAYAATGTSAVAAFGLYTFNNFIPTGPASIDPLGKDVVLTFEDAALQGIRAPRSTGVGRPLFQPIPPVTTATTTFLPVPRVSFAIPDAGQDGAPANGAQKLTATSLLLRERARTYISGNNTLESGSVRVSRPTTAASNDIAVGYTLRYFNVDSTLNTVPATLTSAGTARTFELPNIGAGAPIGLPAPINASPAPVFSPALPAATQVVINGLQGDLSPNTTPVGRPTTTVNVQPNELPGTFFLDAGVTQQLVNFRARYSDQVWPRNPGLQGLRAAVIALRNPDAQNATIYEVERTGGVDTAVVFLLDPLAVPPVITNAIQDKILARPRGTTATEDRIELESPAWRPDNIPGFVFYDDNYNPMTYSAFSEDATLVTAQANNSDPRFSNRPSLYYAVQPGADTTKTVKITVRAFDGTTQDDGSRRLATDEFNIFIRSNVTSVANAGEIGLTVSPNPAVDRVTVQATAKQAGTVRIRVINQLGQTVNVIELPVSAGTTYRQDVDMTGLASGSYLVEVNDGVKTATQKVNKF